jgi:aerobic-type carbon monoxide dehydrogenase small subunit (CoxS/CutS family)
MTLSDQVKSGNVEGDARELVSGNLCRCTGYMGIVAAVEEQIDRRRDGPR